MKRISLYIVSGLILVLDVWLYLQAQEHNGNYILYFGIISAIGLPLATTAFFTAMEWGTREKLSKLTKLSEIDELIKKAETAEEKYKILNTEYKNLENIIRIESEKYYLNLRLKEIESRARLLLDEYDQIEHELKEYEDVTTDNISRETIESLRRRMSARECGNIVIQIGKTDVELEARIFRSIPVFGIVFEGYALLFSQVAKGLNNLFGIRK